MRSVANAKGIHCQVKGGVDYWYATIQGKKTYAGKGEAGSALAVAMRGKYLEERTAKRWRSLETIQLDDPKKVLAPRPCTRANIGQSYEHLVCSDLMRRGFLVYKCLNSNSPFDLIVYRDEKNKPLRVEVTTPKRMSKGKPVLNKQIDPTWDIVALYHPDSRIISYWVVRGRELLLATDNSYETVYEAWKRGEAEVSE